jgi:ParB-like chromosome segregation protein Spo0J
MIIESLQSLAVPIDNLVGLHGNPRKGDVDAVAKSLERFGQRKPIVARKDDGTIIAGNHTWQAAKKLGWSKIAVAFVGDDEITAKAYALADNRTAELGSYDEHALLELIGQIQAVVPEFVNDAGWSDDAIKNLIDKITPAESGEWDEVLADIGGERNPIQQMTFTLHDSQVEKVKEAIAAATALGDFIDTENPNNNGNGLARVCEIFLGKLV